MSKRLWFRGPARKIQPSSTTVSFSHVESDTNNNNGQPVHEEDTDGLAAVEAFDKVQKSHQWDPNLPKGKLDELHEAAQTGDVEKIKHVDEEFADNSPYEEVRAAVRNTDGGEVANTVRAWILGMIFVTVCSGLNMFLSMRSPAINFPAIVVVLLVYPIATLWARIVPMRVFNTCGVRWTFNTGPFTIKEHTVIGIMANVSISYAYATDALLAIKGKPFYNLNMGWGFQLLFTLSSQLIGISLAGLFRRFVIWPSAMIWVGYYLITSARSRFPLTLDASRANSQTLRCYTPFMTKVHLIRIKPTAGRSLVIDGSYTLRLGHMPTIGMHGRARTSTHIENQINKNRIPGVLWQGLSVFAFVTCKSP
jgi:hypothetical protein